MIKQILVCSALIFTASGSQAANQDPKASYNTIKSCTQLLPEGHEFTFSIEGKVDNSNKDKPFEGRFSVSDGTKQSSSPMEEQAKPFIQCIQRLLK